MKLFENIKVDDSTYDIENNHRRTAGISVSGESGDGIDIVIIDALEARVVNVLSLKNKYTKDSVQIIKNYHLSWGVNIAWMETFGFSSFFIDLLRYEGLPIRGFKMSNRGKDQLLEKLVIASNYGKLTFMNHRPLINQLYSLEVTAKSASSGHYHYTYHSDHELVVATALAWYGASEGGVRIDFA